ncbi:MAG: TIGR01777 family protein [Deltaproteobacteria bacterium]|nr:MAG: TIGR01777 family protein [Deltaproteobacteria bacterium]
MKLLITGASGFIGRPLARHLASRGHEIYALSREGGGVEGATPIKGDATREGKWLETMRECDGAVNLAGAPVGVKWSTSAKREIRDSRILSTRLIVDNIPKGKGRFTLISPSAVGIYGDGGEKILTERSPTGGPFLATLAKEWEEEALKGEAKGARVVIARLGVVLSADGGALAELIREAKTPRKIPTGRGGNWVSWVALEDLLNALTAFIEDDTYSGAYNVTSPLPVRQRELTSALTATLGTGHTLNPTSPAIRLILGEMADLALLGQRALPERLLGAGFKFTNVEIAETLRNILT